MNPETTDGAEDAPTPVANITTTHGTREAGGGSALSSHDPSAALWRCFCASGAIWWASGAL